MATSIWKKLADVGGFTRVGDLFNSIRTGNWRHAAYVGNPIGFATEYVNDIKNWDNNSVDSGGNSAATISNDLVKASDIGNLVNRDGSSSLGDITSLDQLGPMITEAVIGAIPEIQRQWSSAEALKEREWQTEMSNSAYQRSVKDMEAAGINPILAYQQGGASSSLGASASSANSASSLGSSLDGISRLIKTLMREDRKDDAQANQMALKYAGSHSARSAYSMRVK